MTADSSYRLLDFGDSRKLESFAGRIIDRPCPAAQGVSPRRPSDWHAAQSVFDGDAKQWIHRTPWPESLLLDCGKFRLPVRPTPFGHVGVFPEQRDNWDWLSCQGNAGTALNLFAYTGAATIALARGGHRVVHVDAAKPNVNAAREVASVNGLSQHPIRYLVDDAGAFVARELRRGNRYRTIVLDPPAYGHSPGGGTWRLERDLWPLLDRLSGLVDRRDFRLLVTGHSPSVDAPDVIEHLTRTAWWDADVSRRIVHGRSGLVTEDRRRLDTGFFVRLRVSPHGAGSAEG